MGGPEVQERLAKSGVITFQRHLVAMARVAMSRGVAQEEGLEEEVIGRAVDVLGEVLRPDEADEIEGLFGEGEVGWSGMDVDPDNTGEHEAQEGDMMMLDQHEEGGQDEEEEDTQGRGPEPEPVKKSTPPPPPPSTRRKTPKRVATKSTRGKSKRPVQVIDLDD